MRILVIDDDEKVSSFIHRGMNELGHKVDIAHDGKDGLFLATTEEYDVLIVDRMLPGIDGLTILHTIRASDNKTPAIILSALGRVEERVKGLRSGADDYLVKPFAFSELLARTELIAARSNRTEPKKTSELVTQELVMNLLSRSVTRGDKRIDLQAREFRLLEYLLRHKGQLVTRTMLMEHVWDYHFDPQTNVIDVHISRLRKKIDADFEKPIISTVRGSGYIVEDVME